MTYVARSTGPLDRLRSRVSSKLLHLRKHVRHRLRNGPRATRVAFLVGSGRSGTDVVASKIGASLDVALVNEDNPAAFENWRLRELDTVDRLVEESAAPVLLFKPIVETYRILELLDHFPGSKAIFLSRNPHDSVNSMIRFFGEQTLNVVDRWIESDFAATRTWSVPPQVAHAAREMYGEGVSLVDAAGIYWFVYNSAFEALDIAADPRILLTLYEDVVHDPDGEVQRACRHLGVSFRAAMSTGVFESSVGRHPPPQLGPPIEDACTRVWEGMRRRRGSPPVSG